MNIQPQYLSFSGLVSKRLFQIPEYQRAYSWKTQHRKDLFDDIHKIHERDIDSHFMATVVCLQRRKQQINTDDYVTLDVVDGQQRLTTLILICKAIFKALSDKCKQEKKLREELDDLLIKDEGQSLLLLQTNHDKSTYFSKYLRDGEVPNPTKAMFLADKDLALAIMECEGFVQEWVSDKKLLELVAIVKNRMMFILHEIEDEALVYTVFEVLNSRGLDVAWLDRTKTALMAVAFENAKPRSRKQLVKELHVTWGKIYDTIGLHQGMSSESLRFAASLRSEDPLSKPLREDESLETLVMLVANDASKTTSLSGWILEVTQAVEALLSDTRRAAVTKIVHARLLAVAIKLSKYSAKDKEVLLEQWERSTFRIFGMCGKDARTGVGEYVRLARAIMARKKVSRSSFAMDKKHIRELAAGEYAIEHAVKELRDTDCYWGWQDELRYFLFRYEEDMAEEHGVKFSNEQWNRIWVGSASKSIEHIYPHNPERGGPWRGAMGPGKAGESQQNRLGNLLLLPPGLNSSLGRKGFSEKKKEYAKTGLLIVQKVVRKNKWNKRSINLREKELIAWAREAWADV